MSLKRRLAAATLGGLIVAGLAVVACSGGGKGAVPGTLPPTVVSLPTYPADFFSGNVACADLLLTNVRLSVTADQAPVGHAVSTASPPTVDSRPFQFVWPQGYSIRATGSAFEVVGPNGTPVLPDGVVIDAIGACVGANDTYKIATINPTRAP